MRTFVVGLVIAGALVACSGDGPAASRSSRRSLKTRRSGSNKTSTPTISTCRRKGSVQIHNLHVGVRADTVASIIDNETGLPPIFPVRAMTVDDVFAEAESAMTSNQG